MFQARRKKNGVLAAFDILELIYHATVRNLRKTDRSPIVGLFKSIVQALVLLGVFFLMFAILGLRSSAVRGDFLLYLLSGIFLFLTHTKAVGAVAGAEGPTSAMMLHAPMNTMIAISAAALSALYTQILAMLVVLTLYYALVTPFQIHDPVGAFAMFLLSWLSGVAVGMVFLALRPWFPGFVSIGSAIYRRANMIASGKMFLANSLTPQMLALFAWNPLFHAIDQCRGFVFINYNPHNSTITYPIYVSITLIMVGLMGEFYTRRRASPSWGAGR